MKHFFKTLLPISIVIFLSFWAIRPLFIPSFFPMHDDTQLARVYVLAKALSFGQFPVRWVPDLGYGFGYPLFNFYAPLPYYIGGIFNLLGFGLLTSTKIMFIFGIVLSGVGMYFLIRELAGEIPGIVGSFLYMYAPYHAVNIYVRGAVGEFYAYGFLPLFLLGIFKIIKAYSKAKKLLINNKIRQGIVISSLSLSLILLSHNILGLITVYFLAFGILGYLFYLIIKKQNLSSLPRRPASSELQRSEQAGIFYLLFSILIGFGLSSFFILPAVVEKKYTKVDELTEGGSDFRNHFVYPDQLWDSPWGYAGSAPGRNDGMSFKIGKLHLILGLIGIFVALLLYRSKQAKHQLSFIFPASPARFAGASARRAGGYLLSSIFFISIFLMLEQSKFIWEILPGFAYIQYPWRFLNIVIFSLTVLSSMIFITPIHRVGGNIPTPTRCKNIFLSLDKVIQVILAVFIIGLTLWFNAKYFIPREYISFSQGDYLSRENLSFKISKISDEYMPPDFRAPENYKEIAGEDIFRDGKVIYTKLMDTPTVKKYNFDLDVPREMFFNLAFFPGWQAKLDGKFIEIYRDKGLIGIYLPSGRHRLEIVFKNTPVRMLSNAISLFSLFLLGYVSLFWKGNVLWKKNIRLK